MKQLIFFKKAYESIAPDKDSLEHTKNDFLSHIRNNLLGEELVLEPKISRRLSFNLWPALVLGAFLLFLVPAAGVWAQESKPGELAFPVKRMFEEVQVLVTFKQENKVALRREYIQRRLFELSQLLEAQQTEEVSVAINETLGALARVPDFTPSDIEDSVLVALEKHTSEIAHLSQPSPFLIELSSLLEQLGDEKESTESATSSAELQIATPSAEIYVLSATVSATPSIQPSPRGEDRKDKESSEEKKERESVDSDKKNNERDKKNSSDKTDSSGDSKNNE